MTKYLITASLLNSYQYYIQDEFKSPEESKIDFLKTLSRERFTPNAAMQKGIDFEDRIRALTEGLIDKEPNVYNQIADIVKGGLWQESCKKDLKIGNTEFLLYGRCDVIKADTVYDIKYTGNYELGKFLGSAQHLIYLYCLDLPKFSYLISDGKDWWREDYLNSDMVENEIRSKVNDFISYLEHDPEAKNIYYSKWASK